MVLAIATGSEATVVLSDLIEGVAEEFSPFEEPAGFSIDGIDSDTAVLQQGVIISASGSQNTNRRPRSPSRVRLGGSRLGHQVGGVSLPVGVDLVGRLWSRLRGPPSRHHPQDDRSGDRSG